jgi:transposase
MTREELQRLSVAELVEMVLQLQATVQQLQARISELEEHIARPKKTPANSSVPPAKGYKANRPESAEGAAKRGPKEGHPGTTRAAAQPDVKIVAEVEQCDRCGQELGAAQHRLVERRQVVEIPPIRPMVVEAEIHQVQCPGCGQRHTAVPAIIGLVGCSAGCVGISIASRSIIAMVPLRIFDGWNYPPYRV